MSIRARAVELAESADPVARATQIDDRALYAHIVEQVRSGRGYYVAAAEELRRHGYPLKPAMAFRLPTLAWIEAMLPGARSRMLILIALAMGAVALWLRALVEEPFAKRMAYVLVVGCGLANVGAPGSVYLHETWSIVFQVAALATMRRSALATGMLVFLALAIRETALPFVVVLATVAWLTGYRRTALHASAAIGLVGLCYLAHVMAIAGILRPDDLVSPGWLGMQGWPLVIRAVQWNLLFAAMPVALVALILPAVMAALATAQSPEAVVGSLTTAIFALALTVVGRSDNYYWGIMISPYLLIGLGELLTSRPKWFGARKDTAGSARP